MITSIIFIGAIVLGFAVPIIIVSVMVYDLAKEVQHDRQVKKACMENGAATTGGTK